MPGDKPTYNPEDEYNYDKELTPEEQAEADRKKVQRTEKMFAFGKAWKEAQPPQLRRLKEKFRSGLPVSHEGRVLPGEKRDRRDKSEIEADREAAMESLKNKIRGLLKSYKLQDTFKFKITVSDKDRERYVFKLLENYKTAEEFEDKFENILSRLEDILKNKYADKLR